MQRMGGFEKHLRLNIKDNGYIFLDQLKFFESEVF
jgi:hypothetical protein